MVTKSEKPRSLPGSDDEFWLDGYRETKELKKSEHKHVLKRISRDRIGCSCGWSLLITNPEQADKLIDRFKE